MHGISLSMVSTIQTLDSDCLINSCLANIHSLLFIFDNIYKESELGCIA